MTIVGDQIIGAGGKGTVGELFIIRARRIQ